MPGRQAAIAHQGRKDRGGRANLDNTLRQGAHHDLKRAQYPASDTRQALEGKDVKDLLLNVGSGGGAAAAPTAGGAAPAAGGDAPAKEEEKEEGTLTQHSGFVRRRNANTMHREGGVGRRHGLRTLRLSAFLSFPFARLPLGFLSRTAAYYRCWSGPVTMLRGTTSIRVSW